uniref:Arachidonate--CoA ligase n=1 Tax=Scleropages formosus TaxID=113540 RepID=A0A8C9W8W5_SCLFO
MEAVLHFLFSPLSTPALVAVFAAGATALLWLNTRPKPLHPPVDLDQQSVGIRDGARKSALLQDDQLVSCYYEDAMTLYEVFQRGFHASGNGPCLGYRKPGKPYHWLKYKQVLDRAEHLGSGLLHRGLTPSPDQFVGIFAQNRPEWIISELACYTYSMVAVPLYDTLGPEALVFIINRADICTVLCDKPDKAEVLLGNCEKGLTPVLKTIVLMDPFGEELVERGRRSGVDLLSMKELEVNEFFRLQKAADRIVCFTSGTTGALSLRLPSSLPSSSAAMLPSVVHHPFTLSPPSSFLPSDLHHPSPIYSQSSIIHPALIVGFFQGDIKLLPDDMKTLQPTVFPAVPRLLNRVYDKVQSGAQTPFKKWLLNFAIQKKLSEVKRGVIRKDSVWDKLIFHKLQASLGGRVRVMVTGAAPISPTVLNFLRASLGCQIFEAYGQTECTASCTFSLPGDSSAGHVGPPIPCNFVKLVDVEEMNYFSSNGEGEVCIKGRNVFKGYLKDPERTAEALDKDGWLHTGDIGKWLPNGVLKIIDRKKNIFKLAQGEYIAPEKIENMYLRSGPVAQVFVHGDSLQSSLVGIVVPDPEVLPDFAAKLGVKGSFEELCRNQQVKKAILSDMAKLGREAGLKSFEQVKDLYLHPEQFTIENGLLTPTLKAKRAELTKFFKSHIESLYANIQ